MVKMPRCQKRCPKPENDWKPFVLPTSCDYSVLPNFYEYSVLPTILYCQLPAIILCYQLPATSYPQLFQPSVTCIFVLSCQTYFKFQRKDSDFGYDIRIVWRFGGKGWIGRWVTKLFVNQPDYTWPVKYTVENWIHLKKEAPGPYRSKETFRNGKCPEINCLRVVRLIVIKQSQWVETGADPSLWSSTNGQNPPI